MKALKRIAISSKLLTGASLIFISVALTEANAEYLFHDGFESGSLLTTNDDGFRWSWGKVSTSDPQSAIVWQTSQGGATYRVAPPQENWTTVEGSHALLFDYLAGENHRETRFNLGKPNREVWIRYWIRVPTNFSHGTSNPSNHKLLALWMDGYEGQSVDGSTVVWEFWNDGSGGSRVALRYVKDGGSYSTAHQQLTQFITIPQDRGRWMEVIFNIKAATNRTSKDGAIRLWRRWANESNFTKLHELLNADIPEPSAGPNGWQHGYLMGWANAAYAQDTYWLIDNFQVSNTPFSDVGGASAQPRAPANLLLKPTN